MRYAVVLWLYGLCDDGRVVLLMISGLGLLHGRFLKIALMIALINIIKGSTYAYVCLTRVDGLMIQIT